MPAIFYRSFQRPISFVLLFIPLILTVLSCGLLILVVAVGPEGYFFPYPAIDTRFAPRLFRASLPADSDWNDQRRGLPALRPAAQQR